MANVSNKIAYLRSWNKFTFILVVCDFINNTFYVEANLAKEVERFKQMKCNQRKI